VALVDHVQQERRAPGRWDWRRTAVQAALYAGVAATYVVIRYAVIGRFLQAPPPKNDVLFGKPLAMRVFTGCEIFAIYVRLLVFPRTLSADYSYRQVPLLDTPDAVAAMGLLAAVVVAGAGLWALRRRVWPVWFAIGFFVVAYSVAANFPIPLQVLVAERLLYLPSVGFCAGVAWLFVALERRTGARRLAAAAIGIVVVLYGARTIARNLDWRDAETIYAATVRAAPQCFAAHFNYSAILLEHGKNEPALEHAEKAYAIRRDHYPLLVNLTSAYLRLGKPDRARDIAREGLMRRPNDKRLKGLLATAEQAAAGAAGSRP
jgi:tetratricopeptide (TPR) repeat protein